MKKEKESFLEYRRRVIDPISKSFCAAKWYNATIWLGSGRTASCHHPPAHNVSIDEIKNNPKALHNTSEKKKCRDQMLRGVRPYECEYCWKIEDIKRDNISDRVFKTMIYTDEEIQQAVSQLGAKLDVDLKTLEIAFDRVCNFACSYCCSTYSTRWGQDIKRGGHYTGFISKEGVDYQNDGQWAMPYEDPKQNPYIQAFWKWWPELSKSLQELRITGGEPLMSDDVWKFFDFFRDNPSEIRLSINSNLGAQQNLIAQLIEKSHWVKNLDIYTSCESIGPHAEYIRDGMVFDQYMKNVREVIKNGNLRALHFMMTINSLCLYSITDFMDILLDLKTEFGANYGYWSVNILRHPGFMSALILPDELRRERWAHLKQWFDKNKSHPMMHDMERDSVQRLIDYLEIVKTPYYDFETKKEDLQKDLKTFYSQYDKRRGKSLEKTFPSIFVDWYNSIS